MLRREERAQGFHELEKRKREREREKETEK